MAVILSLIAPVLFGLAGAQSPDSTPEVHPKLTTYKCTKAKGCVEQTSAIALDASIHRIYQLHNPSLNCGDWGSAANSTVCTDEAACQENCILEGLSDYSAKGITVNGSHLTLTQLVNGTQASPRAYLLNEAEDEYEMLHLTGQELTFDVDMSKLPCGMNSALYLSEMEATGGKSLSDLKVGGAAYGTGYCDAQCYTTPFVNGVGNINGTGLCCNELDIWEANRRATQVAPHTCNQTGLYQCTGEECTGRGVCDKNGCSYNPYRFGHQEFYGEGSEFTVDTSRPFTVVTQFPADESGKLKEIRRLYIQDGTVFENPVANWSGIPAQNFLDDKFCTAVSATTYMNLGGTAGMGEAMARGMVLIFSIWWDASGFMGWLDQKNQNSGPCNATEGSPEFIKTIQPDTTVTFSQIRLGDIGSTYSSQ